MNSLFMQNLIMQILHFGHRLKTKFRLLFYIQMILKESSTKKLASGDKNHKIDLHALQISLEVQSIQLIVPQMLNTTKIFKPKPTVVFIDNLAMSAIFNLEITMIGSLSIILGI